MSIDLAVLRVPVALIGGGSAGPILPPFNSHFVVDDASAFIVTDSNVRVVTYILVGITVQVRDGSNNPRNLIAADISSIGYWQRFGGVRATPGSIPFTPVDVAEGAAWSSGGIFSSGGNLRIYLPIAAMIGDPDEIEIEITPVSGVATILNPIQQV